MISYIILRTVEKLDDEKEKLWYKIVKKLTSPNIVSSELLKRKVGKKYNYKVLLKENMSQEDAKFIVNAWDYYYNNDFEIEISSNDEVIDNNNDDTIDMDDDSFHFIRRIASKHYHNRWVDKKVNEGWRYSLKFSKEEKTHPALKEWDNLPKEHKKLIEIDKKKAYYFYLNNKKLFT